MSKKEKKKEKFNVFGLIVLILWDLTWCWNVLVMEAFLGGLLGTQAITIELVIFMIVIDIIAITNGNKWLITFGCINLIYDFMNMNDYLLFNMIASALLIVAGIVGIMSNKKVQNINNVEQQNIENK